MENHPLGDRDHLAKLGLSRARIFLPGWTVEEWDDPWSACTADAFVDSGEREYVALIDLTTAEYLADRIRVLSELVERGSPDQLTLFNDEAPAGARAA